MKRERRCPELLTCAAIAAAASALIPMAVMSGSAALAFFFDAIKFSGGPIRSRLAVSR